MKWLSISGLPSRRVRWVSHTKETAVDSATHAAKANPAAESCQKTAQDPVPPLENLIYFLTSESLVYADPDYELPRPLPRLSLRQECKRVWQCLQEAQRDVGLVFDAATSVALNKALSLRCKCLHYSGHGSPESLFFENRGLAEVISQEKIARLVSNKFGSTFQLVFVSACHSSSVGQAIADAGVRHVVCVDERSKISDAAALAFTVAFYFALVNGCSVRMAFEQGCRAVWSSNDIRNAEAEMEKFRLLPENGNHDVAIFGRAGPVTSWPTGGTGVCLRSTRNKMQGYPSPPPPVHVVGREVNMFNLLTKVQEGGLVCLRGPKGMGKSTLVQALCSYVNDRASSMPFKRIFYVHVDTEQQRGGRGLVWHLLHQLRESRTDEANGMNIPCGSRGAVNAACRMLHEEDAWVVFDGIDEYVWDDCSRHCLAEVSKVASVLVTATQNLGIIGEKVEDLTPLNFVDTACLFARCLPSQYTEKERRELVLALCDSYEIWTRTPDHLGLRDLARRHYAILGSGVPSEVAHAAHRVSRDGFEFLKFAKSRFEIQLENRCRYDLADPTCVGEGTGPAASTAQSQFPGFVADTAMPDKGAEASYRENDGAPSSSEQEQGEASDGGITPVSGEDKEVSDNVNDIWPAAPMLTEQEHIEEALDVIATAIIGDKSEDVDAEDMSGPGAYSIIGGRASPMEDYDLKGSLEMGTGTDISGEDEGSEIDCSAAVVESLGNGHKSIGSLSNQPSEVLLEPHLNANVSSELVLEAYLNATDTSEVLLEAYLVTDETPSPPSPLVEAELVVDARDIRIQRRWLHPLVLNVFTVVIGVAVGVYWGRNARGRTR